MRDLSICSDVIASFAESCEELNAYARHLWDLVEYQRVVTGADIRNYESGWRLEKWVEVSLSKPEGLAATWWLQLGFTDNAWLAESSISISHSDFYFEFPQKSADSIESLQQALTESVSNLINAMESNPIFKAKVEEYL